MDVLKILGYEVTIERKIYRNTADQVIYSKNTIINQWPFCFQSYYTTYVHVCWILPKY